MEIYVLDTFNDIVKVKSSLGNFCGRWCSPNSPKLKKYFVELDTDEILCSKNITISDKTYPNIKYLDGYIYIFGFVEEIQDGLLFLRLQKDLIIFEKIDDILEKIENIASKIFIMDYEKAA